MPQASGEAADHLCSVSPQRPDQPWQGVEQRHAEEWASLMPLNCTLVSVFACCGANRRSARAAGRGNTAIEVLKITVVQKG